MPRTNMILNIILFLLLFSTPFIIIYLANTSIANDEIVIKVTANASAKVKVAEEEIDLSQMTIPDSVREAQKRIEEEEKKQQWAQLEKEADSVLEIPDNEIMPAVDITRSVQQNQASQQTITFQEFSGQYNPQLFWTQTTTTQSGDTHTYTYYCNSKDIPAQATVYGGAPMNLTVSSDLHTIEADTSEGYAYTNLPNSFLN